MFKTLNLRTLDLKLKRAFLRVIMQLTLLLISVDHILLITFRKSLFRSEISHLASWLEKSTYRIKKEINTRTMQAKKEQK
jgi:hypothetical protein